MTSSDPDRPLDGVIVVALEVAVAAPIATRHLADLGARVLKVEVPGRGDFARHYDTKMSGQSTYFVWANAGKDSIALDLKAPGDRASFDRLVAGADVFIQNLSPAAAERAGVSSAQLCAIHPHLIACDISGYGLDGPRTDDKAYDMAIQAESGAMALTGSPDAPSKVGFSVADICAGMYALSSILAALVRRERTGLGAAISLSMLECLTTWTAVQIYASAADGEPVPRNRRRHGLIAPYGLFDLDDGSTVLIAVQADHEFVALCDGVLHRGDLAHDSRFATAAARIANVDDLEAEMRSALLATPASEIRRRLVEARVANATMRDPLEVWNHEQLVARDRKVEVELPGGETATVLKPPFNIADVPPQPDQRVPDLDEHDPALVAELNRRAEER